MSTFSNIFYSETTGPIEAKFHVEAPWDGEMKVHSNGPGDMTNMAAIPIYGINLKNSSSPEPRCLLTWNLVYSIECSSTTKCIQMMTLDGPWSNLVPYAFVWEKGKTLDFAETIVVCDIKVGRWS